MRSPELLLLVLCALVGVLIYVAVSFLARRISASFPMGVRRASRVGELLLLMGFAVVGALLVNSIVRWYFAGLASTIELIQGLLISLGTLLLGMVGAYGATLPRGAP